MIDAIPLTEDSDRTVSLHSTSREGHLVAFAEAAPFVPPGGRVVEWTEKHMGGHAGEPHGVNVPLASSLRVFLLNCLHQEVRSRLEGGENATG